MSGSSGLSPQNPRDYVGPNVYLVVCVNRNRQPTGADYRQPETGKLYPINSFWQVSKNPTTGNEGEIWVLNKIVANVAYWTMLSGGIIGPLLSVTVPLGVSPIIPDGTGTMHFTSSGGTIAITGSSASPNNHTINFDLVGGTVALDSVQVQAITAPGVNPVTPDSNGLMTVSGLTVVNHSVPIETRSRALHAYNVEVQYATTSATSDATKNGLAHFNSNQFTVDANGFVSTIGTPMIGASNLGVAYNAGTFTVEGSDGTALSSTNPAYVTLQSTTAGLLKTVAVTANQTFTDGAGGTTATQRFGLTAGVNWAQDIPFFLYAVLKSDQSAIAFMISRNPCATQAPIAARIGQSGSVVNVNQSDFFSLRSITTSDYDSQPCVNLGSFRMQFVGATNSWTVQTLAFKDGIGEFNDQTIFTLPTGVNGSSSGKYFQATATTQPSFTGNDVHYTISKSGIVNMTHYHSLTSVNGVGAGDLRPTLPYSSAETVILTGITINFAAGALNLISTMGVIASGNVYIDQIVQTGSSGLTPLTNADITATSITSLEFSFSYKAY